MSAMAVLAAIAALSTPPIDVSDCRQTVLGGMDCVGTNGRSLNRPTPGGLTLLTGPATARPDGLGGFWIKTPQGVVRTETDSMGGTVTRNLDGTLTRCRAYGTGKVRCKTY